MPKDLGMSGRNVACFNKSFWLEIQYGDICLQLRLTAGHTCAGTFHARMRSVAMQILCPFCARENTSHKVGRCMWCNTDKTTGGDLPNLLSS